MRSRLVVAAVTVLAFATAAQQALAAFPYARPGADTSDYTDLYLGAGQVPDDLGGNEFKFAATVDPANSPLINNNPVELGGVRGAHVVDDDAGVDTGFMHTTGRPDVTIAILDSGIKWNDEGAMNDIRFKTRINKGEVPKPRNDNPASPREQGEDCSGAGPYSNAGDWDLNGDGVFNLRDYSCDDRVERDTPKGVGPSDLFEPQDILIAFSDEVDDDDGGAGNGYVDDIVGWDFLDDDNDPYDDVQYGHGTGEARDSTSETDNGNDAASCPNCMGIHLRVGDSFIADVNRFGQAVIYGVDNDVQVIQEALGTLNNSSLGRQAVNYAYRHGVTVMASAADEAAQHNNWPSSLPHTIVVNSVRDNPVPAIDKSYLAFNGCTNFNPEITLAIPSTSCSSNAVGLAAGYAGLVYSAAYTAHDLGKLDTYPDPGKCRQANGDPCIITPNEVRQILASGRFGGVGQADDVNFAGSPPASGNEPSCTPFPVSGCTSPYGLANALKLQVDANRPAPLGPQVVSDSYPARQGHDQFYGYGRVNLAKALSALLDDPANPSLVNLPPEVEIYSPEWFEQVDPGQADIDVEGEVFARGADYTCELLVAPGQYPNNARTTDSFPGDYAAVPGGYCDGSTLHSGAEAASLYKGTLGTIDVADLKARFPATTNFNGPIPVASEATGNGRPFFAPHAFTVKVVVTPTAGPDRSGEDQRSAFLHRDADLLPGYPKSIADGGKITQGDPTADGESSPALADLDGDNRNELIFATADGFVHAIGLDGSELSGWPVRSDPAPFFANHTAGKAYAGGEVPTNRGAMFLASVAVGDPDHDGIPTVFGADYEGKVYGWDPDGNQVFEEESNPAYGGKPLQPFENVRQGELNRTGHGFFGSPVLADLDGDGSEELIAAAMDRHLYAWETDDSDPTNPGGADLLDGFPVLVVDPAKVESVDPDTHALTYKADAEAKQQGAIIDTPAVGDLGGDSRPEIVIGTNEEYIEDPNSSGFNSASLGLLGQLGTISSELDILGPGNTRLFVVKPDGDTDGDPLPTDALADGWPKPMALAITELLPVVGEGVTGSPVIGPVDCPSGGSGPKIGSGSAAGPSYIFNPDGSSCYGEGPDGKDISLQTDATPAPVADHPVLPAVGHPAFGDFSAAGSGPSFMTPAAGVIRASDLALPEYQGGQDYVAVWDPSSGQFQADFPVTMNDLQFLTGPSIADIDGRPGEEMLEGSASQDFAAYTNVGTPVPGWPKLSTDWTVANPLIGSLGTRDTDDDAEKVVIMMTRSGYLSAFATDAEACSPSSWPRFHHDNANSGDYERDAVLPGKPTALALDDAGTELSFEAPGDDLLCGTATRFEIVTSGSPIDERSFASAKALDGEPTPGEAGSTQTYGLPAIAKRYLAIRAVDDQGNVGRVASIDLGIDAAAPGGDCEEVVAGTGADDRLVGSKGGDRIKGRGGKDRIYGRKGNDCVYGNRGNDRVKGNAGDDLVRGGAGRDRIRGGHGNDSLKAGTGRDRINAGPGNDRVNAKGGRIDTISCGPGRDSVVAGKNDRVARNCERVKRR